MQRKALKLRKYNMYKVSCTRRVRRTRKCWTRTTAQMSTCNGLPYSLRNAKTMNHLKHWYIFCFYWSIVQLRDYQLFIIPEYLFVTCLVYTSFFVTIYVFGFYRSSLFIYETISCSLNQLEYLYVTSLLMCTHNSIKFTTHCFYRTIKL